jgi:mono/diheme cytochrome c family protein
MNRSRPFVRAMLPICLCGAAAVGCQQKMAEQPSFRPNQPAAFLPSGTSSQLPVPGTVARGYLRTDLALFTGRTSGVNTAGTSSQAGSAATQGTGNMQTLLAAEMAQYRDFATEFPFPITQEIVEHGFQRYMIYCVVCHDPLGTGQGKIVERGYTRPPSYHIVRLRDAPVGHFFRVMTEGYGSMPSYAAQIPVDDRWAIAAYIRALQFSQHCPTDESPKKLSTANSTSAASSAKLSATRPSTPSLEPLP